jgi:hypothetical protein
MLSMLLKTRIGIMLAAAAIVLGACSNGTGNKSSSAAGGTAGNATATTSASAIARVPKGQALDASIQASRQIVYTAHLQVRVNDVVRASTRSEVIVDDAGGYLFSQDANLQGHTDETLVFKVPPARFSQTLDQLSALGTPLDKQVATNDVTDQVVDLQGRLQTATASASRLRVLFQTATNVGDIVTIENDLATREAEVESLQGQLRLVKSQVQLATVTLALTTKAPHHKPTTPGIASALSAGWTAFVASAEVTGAVVAASLPFLGFAVIVAGIVVVARRRRRRPAGLDAQGSVV